MLKEIYHSTYEITPQTMAVLSDRDSYGNIQSRILEQQQEYIVRDKPLKIIDYACKFFGKSLRGLQDGTKSVCGITHKAPLAIEHHSGMYFFPTASPTNPNCSWIAHSHVEQINSLGKKGVEVVFKNGQKVEIKVSIGIMQNQVRRTAQYRYLLGSRFDKIFS